MSAIASLQAVLATETSYAGGNDTDVSDSPALLQDNTNSKMNGASTGLSAPSTYIAWDMKLNAVYKKIRSLLSPANQNKLKDWQMAWIKNKDRIAKKAGSPAEKEKMLTEYTKDRLQDLQELLTAVEDDSEQELDYEDENAHNRYFNANGSNELLIRNFPEKSVRLTLGITLPPGVFCSGRRIRAMWPELRYLDTKSDEKLMVCKFSEPDEKNSVEGFATWHNGYYLSPNGSYAIIEAMDDEAFHSDGAQGQTCYYVYELPALSDVPRGVPIGASPKELTLKPIKTLTTDQLAKDYPIASAQSKEGAALAVPQKEGNETAAYSIPPSESQNMGISMPREFVGTWNSRPMSEESQVVITTKEIRYYLGEVVGKITKITRLSPFERVCELECTEIDEKWNDVARLKLLANGDELKFNDRNEKLYRSQ